MAGRQRSPRRLSGDARESRPPAPACSLLGRQGKPLPREEGVVLAPGQRGAGLKWQSLQLAAPLQSLNGKDN